jgi:hypothetical protein
MKRLAVIAFALLLVVIWGSPAQADPPVREVIEVNDTFPSDVCGFPTEEVVVGTIIRTTYSDADGTVTRIHEAYPKNFRVAVTNLDSGEVYETVVPGSLMITFHSDGSLTVVGTGLWDLESNPTTGEPGIFIVKGRWVVEVPPGTFSHVGTFIDVCELLA